MQHGSNTLRAATVVALIVAQPAVAKPADSPVVHDMLACQTDANSTTRLACFDKTVAAFANAAGNDALVVVDREQMRTARRSLFGFTVPNLSILGFGGTAGDDQPEIVATVQSVSQTRDGHWRLVLNDGAVWVQIDDSGPFHAPHANSKVVIRRATVGTYFIRCDGQIGFRATRRS